MTDQPHNGVVDDRPTDQPSGHVDQPATDQPTPPLPLTLEEAALELGITVNAVRQRIKRGTLVGIKTDAGWLVDVVATNQQPTTDRPPTSATNQLTDHQPTIDLAPLADLIERQARELADLREAATMWQIRARQAEEQLKALGAGDVAPDASQEAVESPRTSEAAPRGLRDWWHRFWRHVEGA